MRVAIASCAAAKLQAALSDCAAQAVRGTASSGELQAAAQGARRSQLRWRQTAVAAVVKPYFFILLPYEAQG